MSSRQESAEPASGPCLPDTSDAERAELQRQGAKASARGEPRESNPMLDFINRPQSTGESHAVWESRRDAWEEGRAAQECAPAPQDRLAGGSEAHGGTGAETRFGVTRVLTFAGRTGLTAASGFFFEREGRLFLVTSRHVLFDAPSGHAPDRIEVEVHTDRVDLTRVSILSILLHRDRVSVWRHAQDSGGEIDVAALELDVGAMPEQSVVHAFGPQHLALGFDQFEVGDQLAIPGFPLGFFDTVHHLPVVRQASIASHFGVRFQGMGFFLTDGRMHRGSSGSPVLARLSGQPGDAPRWRLLGVHSSRMDMATRDEHQDESLGLNCAWYADILRTLTADSA
jgi:Trypsin-like peptidase domain